MKIISTIAAVLLSFSWQALAAETTVKLSNVHLCCNLVNRSKATG